MERYLKRLCWCFLATVQNINVSVLHSQRRGTSFQAPIQCMQLSLQSFNPQSAAQPTLASIKMTIFLPHFVSAWISDVLSICTSDVFKGLLVGSTGVVDVEG